MNEERKSFRTVSSSLNQTLLEYKMKRTRSIYRSVELPVTDRCVLIDYILRVLTSSNTNLSDGTKPFPFSPASLPLTSVLPTSRLVATSRRGSLATVNFFRRFAMSGGTGARIIMLLPASNDYRSNVLDACERSLNLRQKELTCERMDELSLICMK